MGKNERKAYLEAIRGRYRKASRAAKTRILDEFCAARGMAGGHGAFVAVFARPLAQPRYVGHGQGLGDGAVLVSDD